MTVVIVSDASKHKFFIEYIQSIQYHAITLFNCPCQCIYYEDFYFDNNAIYIAVQTIPPFLLSSKNVLLLQTEQCSRKSIRNLFTTKIPIIDYSRANLSHLSNHHCLYLPLYPHLYTSLLSIEPSYDIIMIGSPSPRRQHIWNNVLRLFPRSHFITDNVFDPYQRMKYLLQHRILLNIHYASDYTILEELRCVPAVFHQMIVLSEDSMPCGDHPLSKYIVFTEYVRIIHVLSEIMSDPNGFKKRLYHNFDINKIRKKYDHIYKEFQNEWRRLILS